MDNLIAAPDEPDAWAAWRQTLAAWRDSARAELGHEEQTFRHPAFAWVNDCIVMHKILMWDERFYDRQAHVYRVESYVDAFEERFGRLDGVILWHAYPNIGFDRRNQFDFYRRMPGGLDGLHDAVDRFHARGIRVLLDFNPWDRTTRREEKPDHEVLAGLVGALDADGLYLDTMAEAAGELRDALDAVKPGVVFESQSFTPLERIGDHHMSWAEVYRDAEVPGVLRNAWFERWHRMHIVHRWVSDHRGELQLAWMNGQGMVVWENIFGSWNGWCDRDAAWLRLMGAVQHRFRKLFSDGAWIPLADNPADGVYASCWDDGGMRLWTLVNRRDTWRRDVPLRTCYSGRCVDLLAGREGAAVDLPPRGLGAVLEQTGDDAGPADEAFLAAQAAVWGELQSSAGEAPARRIIWRVVQPTQAHRDAPAGMASVPGGPYRRKIVFRRRECGLYDSARAPGCQSHTLPGLHETVSFVVEQELKPFAIERRCVSNRSYAAFMAASGYAPRHGETFLEHWEESGPPAGLADAPVTWIDLDDARAYARWSGRRLPREAEWQKAAELGLFDDEPRLWTWTEREGSDGRTRFCILKGGSDFEATGTAWYADGGPKRPEFAARYLLLWPGLDRCGTIGFRTVVDL